MRIIVFFVPVFLFLSCQNFYQWLLSFILLHGSLIELQWSTADMEK
jgi:hypothetical protein